MPGMTLDRVDVTLSADPWDTCAAACHATFGCSFFVIINEPSETSRFLQCQLRQRPFPSSDVSGEFGAQEYAHVVCLKTTTNATETVAPPAPPPRPALPTAPPLPPSPNPPPPPSTPRAPFAPPAPQPPPPSPLPPPSPSPPSPSPAPSPLVLPPPPPRPPPRPPVPSPPPPAIFSPPPPGQFYYPQGENAAYMQCVHMLGCSKARSPTNPLVDHP
mmetsp:Transcript_31699/g.94488  ORF Transcript_31699/g.94488 Transcript_31699/m.94488 type:complete len:216 (+) Transcript_31699:2964-3611(+)